MLPWLDLLRSLVNTERIYTSQQVDKAHQRILQGHRSSMYTAEASIHGKVKGVSGWRELLQSLGFRFQKANNGLPNSVFFPTSNRLMDKLMAASNNLQALLGNLKANLS